MVDELVDLLVGKGVISNADAGYLYGEVAETKRSLEQMVRSAGDAIISLDRRGAITGWNRPASARSLASGHRVWKYRKPMFRAT